MSKFYFLLWLNWAFKVTINSVLMAGLFSLLITFVLYMKQGSISLSPEVIEALWKVFIFWFPLTWSLTLLLTLFRSLKYIFNKCYSGYQLQLFECNQTEIIEVVGYGDLVKVWRRWFMLLIWLSGAQMVLALALSYIFSIYDAVFDWFNIYVLFIFVLNSGYISFILLGGRCKKVKVVKC